MFRYSTYGKQILQYVNNLHCGKRSGDLDGQAFAGEFIDHHQQPNLSSVFKPISNEVVRPNVIPMLGTTTNAAILATATWQSSTTVLFLRHLHVLFPPKSFNSFVIDTPSTRPQRTIHARAAEPMATLGNASHFREQLALISRTSRLVTLCRPRLAEHPAHATLGNFIWPQLATHLIDCAATSLGA
jgi:hypothetical protein